MSGNHTWNGSCAERASAATITSREKAMPTASSRTVAPTGRCSTSATSTVRNMASHQMIASRSAVSPMRATTKDLIAADASAGRSRRCATSRYVPTASSSHPAKSNRRSLAAITSRSAPVLSPNAAAKRDAPSSSASAGTAASAMSRAIAVSATSSGTVDGSTRSAKSAPRSGSHGPSSASSDVFPAANACAIASAAPNASARPNARTAPADLRPSRRPRSVMSSDVTRGIATTSRSVIVGSCSPRPSRWEPSRSARTIEVVSQHHRDGSCFGV